MADEIAELVALAVIDGEHAVVAAGDDGLDIGGEAVGAMTIAIGGVALDGGDGLAVPHDIENGVIATRTAAGPTLSTTSTTAFE
jgi:hypothetical protein